MTRVSRFLLLLLPVVQMVGCLYAPVLAPQVSTPSASIGQSDLETAVQAYEQGEYADAIRILMSILQRYPGAPILSETQWMLAKSYEAEGEDRLALEEYLRFMKNYPGSTHFLEAKLRSDILIEAVGIPSPQGPLETIRAVQLMSAVFTDQKSFEATIQMFSSKGVNTLIIPVIQPSDSLPGVLFKTDEAPLIQDLLKPVLTVAHNHRMRVFASLPLRQLDWLKDRHWMDLKFDPATGSFEPSGQLDLWNPAVQAYLLSLYLDLAAYSLDGLIIEEPVGYSETEGFNETGLKQFNEDFGLSVLPSDLYRDGPLSPAFWKWTGWKNRRVTAVLKHLVHELHLKRPQLRIGLAMSNETIGQPIKALVNYGQDLLEAKDAEFDFFVFAWPPRSFRPGDLAVTVKQAKELLSDPDKVMFRIEQPSQPEVGGIANDYFKANSEDLQEITGISVAFVGVRDSFPFP